MSLGGLGFVLIFTQTLIKIKILMQEYMKLYLVVVYYFQIKILQCKKWTKSAPSARVKETKCDLNVTHERDLSVQKAPW